MSVIKRQNIFINHQHNIFYLKSSRTGVKLSITLAVSLLIWIQCFKSYIIYIKYILDGITYKSPASKCWGASSPKNRSILPLAT